MTATIALAAATALSAGVFALVQAWRRHLAEITVSTSALVLIAGFELARGLTGSDVIGVLAVPAGAAVAAPLLLPGVHRANNLVRAWRSWCRWSLVVGGALAALLAVAAGHLTAIDSAAPLPIASSVFSIGVLAGIAWRHVRLYRVGARNGSALTAVGLAAAAIGTIPGTGSPSAECFVLVGLAAAALGLTAELGPRTAIAPALAPLVDRDPMIGLELELTPIVRRYVAAIERKDPLTRDHGLRVGELALRVGKRAGLSADRLQALGLAALLHDAGKLFTPLEILLKPAALTADEFDAVKHHPVWGAEILASSPVLAPAADLVRWHHERVDGLGYPDGLRGSEIPLEAAIISVCDAWDAMTYSLRYRSAMSPERARWILLGGSGTQWSPRAVDLVLEELVDNGPVDYAVYHAVEAGPVPDDGDVDDDAIPEEARAHLE